MTDSDFTQDNQGGGGGGGNGDGDSGYGRSRIMQDATDLLSTAKEKLGEVAEPIRDKAMEVAADQKDRGVKHIEAVARAVDGAAGELDDEMPRIAGYIHDGAESLGRIARDVKNRNLEELAGMFTDFARRQPALAFGGCVLAGFALSRFLKSSSSPARPHTQYDAGEDLTDYQGA